MAASTRVRLLRDDFCVLDSLLRSIEGVTKARLIDRLQEVIDGVDLECANRVLVIRRDETR